jgi:malonyl-CoA O-methyltransferase
MQLNIVPDKAAASRNFSRAAPTYDAHAFHQRRVAARLCKLLPPAPAPRAVLELGCGTGILTALLRERFPEADIAAVDIAPGMIAHCRARHGAAARFELGDAESFRNDRPCDLVASSLCFQWFRDKAAALANAREQLAPGGLLALAAPVEGTLLELAESFAEATGTPWPHLAFEHADAYEDSCRHAGFASVRALVEDVRIAFADPRDVVRGLRALGAGFAGHGGFAPLSVAALRRLVARYRERFGSADGTVAATYRVLYLRAEAE